MVDPDRWRPTTIAKVLSSYVVNNCFNAESILFQFGTLITRMKRQF